MNLNSPLFKLNKRGVLTTIQISDIHFGAFNPSEQYDYLDKQFLEKIKKIKFDILCICGDLFDHKFMSESDSVMYCIKFFEKIMEITKSKRALTIVLKGTTLHDSNQLKLFYHYLNNNNLVIVEEIQLVIHKDVRILCIPELYDVPKEVYINYLHYNGYYDICLLHGVVEGGFMIEDIKNQGLHSSRPVFRIEDFSNCRNLILCGHIHKPMCLNKYIYYIGSPYAWRFDDDHDKGFLITIIDLDNNRHYSYMKKIKSRVYRTIKLSDIMNNNIEYIIKYIKEFKNKNKIDYLRLVITADINEITKSNVQLLLNYFRKDTLIKIDKSKFIEKQNTLVSDVDIIDNDYAFLIDDTLDYKNKFVKYVNMKMGDKNYTTLDELNKYLNGEV